MKDRGLCLGGFNGPRHCSYHACSHSIDQNTVTSRCSASWKMYSSYAVRRKRTQLWVNTKSLPHISNHVTPTHQWACCLKSLYAHTYHGAQPCPPDGPDPCPMHQRSSTSSMTPRILQPETMGPSSIHQCARIRPGTYLTYQWASTSP